MTHKNSSHFCMQHNSCKIPCIKSDMECNKKAHTKILVTADHTITDSNSSLPTNLDTNFKTFINDLIVNHMADSLGRGRGGLT